ncbi:MAG: FAD-binding protein [Flavobacteriaceae bacterium]
MYLEVNAGENWHELVLWCVENNYGGIENLAYIPGNIGAAPIQNIGAYGTELQDVFSSCMVMEKKTGEIEKFFTNDCEFDYRDSVFKMNIKINL